MKETNITGTSEGALIGNLDSDGKFLPLITTYTGRTFNLLEPEFDIEDIAHALSMTCRFAGHCKLFYSVAEHSVLVSRLMEELKLGDPMVGLMHDAHEAYLSDVPSPFKQLLPDWCALDVQLEEALYAAFELPFPREAGCKDADVIAFFIERAYLWEAGQNEAFNAIKFPHLKTQAEELVEGGRTINCFDPYHAKRQFLKRYDELQKQAGEK